MMDNASHPSSTAERPGPPEVQPPSRTMRLLTSWKLWPLALVLILVAIGVAVSIRGYQRYQVLLYLDNNDCDYELTDDDTWITDRFGERAMGFRSVDSVHLSVVSDESLSHISVFPELREMSMLIRGSSARPILTISDHGIDELMQLSQLERIALYAGDFTDSQLASLFAADLPLSNVQLRTGEVSHATLEALSRRAT